MSKKTSETAEANEMKGISVKGRNNRNDAATGEGSECRKARLLILLAKHCLQTLSGIAERAFLALQGGAGISGTFCMQTSCSTAEVSVTIKQQGK